MAQLRDEIDRIHAHGAELVVVGNGTPAFARAFREAIALESPLYVDASGEAYRALGMRRGIVPTLGSIRTWVHHGRALLDGIREKRLLSIVQGWWRSVPVVVFGKPGDAWQLGGVLVVLPSGRVAYRYLSAIAGDHPPVSEVLSALAPSSL